jgi:PIN domain nuclease of toxin-antitoxin system
MRVLIDSHVLIWALDDPARLGSNTVTTLRDPANELLLSTTTVWELAVKVGIGNLPLSLPFRAWMEKAIVDLRLLLLPFTLDHAERYVGLPFHHRDPFDRLIAAQALADGVPLVSVDAVFDGYGVTRISG